MAKIERVWPLAYRIVLCLTIILLVVAAVIYVFMLRPGYEERQNAQDDYDAELAKVRKSEWDSSDSGIAHATKLYTLAIGTKRQPAGRDGSDARRKRATGHLQSLMDKVKEESRNPNITKDGKKTYSDQYDKLKKELAEGPQRLELVPAVYGMGRASEGNFYYMTLKLLMTREVVALLQRHKLSIVQSDTGYAPEPSLQYMDIRERDSLPKVRASLCTVLPVRAYTLREGEQPYLLEVPFKATIRGAMGNFTAFVRDLQAEGRFFVLTNLEMQTDKPVLLNMRRDQLIKSQETEKGIRIETVTATIKCSGFALPEVDRMDEALKQRSRDWVKERPQAPVEKPIGI